MSVSLKEQLERIWREEPVRRENHRARWVVKKGGVIVRRCGRRYPDLELFSWEPGGHGRWWEEKA